MDHVCECAWKEVTLWLCSTSILFLFFFITSLRRTRHGSHVSSKWVDVIILHIVLWEKYKLETKTPEYQQVASRAPWSNCVWFFPKLWPDRRGRADSVNDGCAQKSKWWTELCFISYFQKSLIVVVTLWYINVVLWQRILL